MSDSVLPHRWQPTRILCPWDSPGKNTGVGCYALLQGIFLTEGLNMSLLHCRRILHQLSHKGSPRILECARSIHLHFYCCPDRRGKGGWCKLGEQHCRIYTVTCKRGSCGELPHSTGSPAWSSAQLTPVFLPGESQGRRSLVGCRLWGHTESDTTEVT